MIVLDIETSGLYPEKNGIWQIAALDLDNPSNTFNETCRIDNEDICDWQALDFLKKTEEELRDKSKKSQKELIEHFFKWIGTINMKGIIAQNPVFDVNYISHKSRKYGLVNQLHFRTFDLHAIAAHKYFLMNNKWLLSKDGTHSDMNLSQIQKLCGLIEIRRSTHLVTGEVIREGKVHDALDDAKITAECFSRIVYGKELLPEFSSQPIPDYLKK